MWKQKTVGEDYIAQFLNDTKFVAESLQLIPSGQYVIVVYMEKL